MNDVANYQVTLLWLVSLTSTNLVILTKNLVSLIPIIIFIAQNDDRFRREILLFNIARVKHPKSLCRPQRSVFSWGAKIIFFTVEHNCSRLVSNISIQFSHCQTKTRLQVWSFTGQCQPFVPISICAIVWKNDHRAACQLRENKRPRVLLEKLCTLGPAKKQSKFSFQLSRAICFTKASVKLLPFIKRNDLGRQERLCKTVRPEGL